MPTQEGCFSKESDRTQSSSGRDFDHIAACDPLSARDQPLYLAGTLPGCEARDRSSERRTSFLQGTGQGDRDSCSVT